MLESNVLHALAAKPGDQGFLPGIQIRQPSDFWEFHLKTNDSYQHSITFLLPVESEFFSR